MHKLVTFMILGGIFVVSGCTATPQLSNTNNTNDTYSANPMNSNYQSQMLSYINNIRASGATCAPSAPALKLNSALESSAQAHANDMVYNNMFTHTGSGTASDPAKSVAGVGSEHVQRMLYFGFPKKEGALMGEVIGYSSFGITKTEDYMRNFKHAVTRLINDYPHCKIIMNPRFTDIGVAMKKGDKHYDLVVDLAESR